MLVIACVGCGRLSFDELPAGPTPDGPAGDTPLLGCTVLAFDDVPPGFVLLGNGNISAVNGQIKFAIDGVQNSEAYLEQTTASSFVGRSVAIQATAPSMTQSASTAMGWHSQNGDLVGVHLEFDGFNLKFNSYNPTLDQYTEFVSVPYDTVEFAWWRLRHMVGNGSVFAEVSRDGVVWNAFGSASPAIDFTNMKWDLGLGSFVGNIAPSETSMDNSIDCPP